MPKVKGYIEIDQERCKGCGLCINACPMKVIEFSEEFNSKGYHPAEAKHLEKCIACGFCYRMCPDVCITVYREE
ncbi:tungsten formylmethanofuran dehydrogenase [Thermosipho melanesiensis]|uniref:4Fe-4S ferredoxin, iron-sulfur binding domain protein n=2 Tax=Thermosipho melanesiensis TaxID=46541 RepID=A6LJ81_THEM4|nr:ferredoxin family protein [Thermosipho melanesiensis]ABR29982.1 4Fe-4S ferredoxin, iron-sulfur binding domain protein [Thermosipho melanesiensis BI429]APT73186.1 tungsten formylmethanofuran dehydrogenase [Thermosipho melanesiensis]OOC38581.1 tungsten formylmethanofuran dehydrogenase [Thermosipho melanesiensis]OOC40385.1 tungsten formylmethanofuran dehydrogenase [Thermosipho melanesiensis]OOC40649.1 tungsten formylmethanofuran dehydrogenase [Thermosipho melanesiensis]